MNRYLIIVLIFIGLIVGWGIFIVVGQGQERAMEKSGPINEEAPEEAEKSYILAGKTTPYIEFNKLDYEKAVSSGKIIFLEFYANWCPICRAQEPKLFEGFDALTDEKVIGFRVNYNDDETNELEKQLAKDFGVTYQHTHVILRDGKVVSKTNDDLDKESFVSLVENVSK